MTARASQMALFGRERPSFDASFATLERIELRHGAWLDLARSWLHGDAGLFDVLYATTPWRSESRVMYERQVDVPRQYAVLQGGPPPLPEIRAALDRRYRTSFQRLSVALYRDGKDSVAWHGDHVARRMPEALVATISVGAPRRFLLRPTGGGESIRLSLGSGDLLVMGGTCQRTYQHCVPKVAHAEPRIAIMFRPIWITRGEAPGSDRAAQPDAPGRTRTQSR